MLNRQRVVLAFLLLGALIAIFTSIVAAQNSKLDLKIEDLMTAQELKGKRPPLGPARVLIVFQPSKAR